MEISQKIEPNALDATGAGKLVGRAIDRVDGRLKVTGAATYAHEYKLPATVHGHIVSASVGRGTISAIDRAATEAMPGVLLVLTHENAPRQVDAKGQHPVLKGREVMHWGQHVALVVADTPEHARDAAISMQVTYAPTAGRFDGKTIDRDGVTPKDGMFEPDTTQGNFDSAFASAAVKVDTTYTTPDQSHAPMEPQATLAHWEGIGSTERVTIYTSHQMLGSARTGVAKLLGIDEERVRVISRYVGGGFGSKLELAPDVMLACLAARQLGKPVKIALTRPQVFMQTSRRSETWQRVRIGADANGRMVALAHDTVSDNLEGDTFFEPAGLGTRLMYAAPNRITTHRLAGRDKTHAASMRAPGEAVGMLALENAVDELAEKLGIDPVELRLKNEPEQDPEKKIPYSSRKLVECLKDGAARFGWSRRRAPREAVEGRWWIGMGVAAAVRGNLLRPSKARVVIYPDGRVTVQSSMTDIGTGTYTVLAQIAADMLGAPLERVTVELGDTSFPAGAGSGGSWGASSAGTSVYDACEALRIELAKRAGMALPAATFKDNEVLGDGRRAGWASLMQGRPLEAAGEVKPGKNEKSHSQASHGAHFAEVAVNMDTGEVRVRRMLGVFAAGRILNEKTARSQCVGGMIFGIGAALTEELVTDLRSGAFVNHDLAEYHVPVHADVPSIEVVFLQELDDWANPLRAKGVGELGISGAGAAVTNAIYNACGVRVRDYPMTLDKVLQGLPRT